MKICVQPLVGATHFWVSDHKILYAQMLGSATSVIEPEEDEFELVKESHGIDAKLCDVKIFEFILELWAHYLRERLVQQYS